jgi:hypothetical protein
MFHAIVFKREPHMKYILILSILAVSLGGCVVVPAGYDDNRSGYHQDHGYDGGEGNLRRYDDRDHGS